MASIHNETIVDVRPEVVWDASRDFGAAHRRWFPGLLRESRMDGDARVVTFANGAIVRERLVDLDDVRRRLVYAVVEGALGVTHHNASIRVEADGEGRSRIVWTTDVLPNELADRVRELVGQGSSIMKRALTSGG
jgi:hypothetical protein